MKIKLKDKETWNKVFVVLPVKTLENNLVWMEYVHMRERYIGVETTGYGSDFVIEYTQDASSYV